MHYILTAQALTVFYKGVITLHKDDPRFPQAIELLRAEAYEDLVDLIKPIARIANYVSDTGDIRVEGGCLYYKEHQLDTYAAQQIIAMHDAGLPIHSLVRFLENVMQNPSARAVQELMQFLEFGNLPITSDGYFLAYKRVRDNYFDVHSGTYDNSVGSICSMPRNEVQDDPNITCSSGLHFCSLDYLAHFSGSRIMVLKINPKDVVSIPNDYNNTKGRCSEYMVVAELKGGPDQDNHWNTPVVDEFDAITEPESESESESKSEPKSEPKSDKPTASMPHWFWEG